VWGRPWTRCRCLGVNGTSRLMSPETGRRKGHRSRSRRVREEVDLGQIHVPAQSFIVDEMVAPVGGGSSGGAESPDPLSQGVSGERSSVRPLRITLRSSKAALPTSCCVGRAAPRFLHQPQLFAHALNRLCQAAAVPVNRVRIGFLCERVDGHATIQEHADADDGVHRFG
jgi:hypothetical protein